MKYLVLLPLFITSLHAFGKGMCNCPDDNDRSGKRCGKRSAFCKLGGKEPYCGALDRKEATALKLKFCK